MRACSRSILLGLLAVLALPLAAEDWVAQWQVQVFAPQAAMNDWTHFRTGLGLGVNALVPQGTTLTLRPRLDYNFLLNLGASGATVSPAHLSLGCDVLWSLPGGWRNCYLDCGAAVMHWAANNGGSGPPNGTTVGLSLGTGLRVNAACCYEFRFNYWPQSCYSNAWKAGGGVMFRP